MSRTYNFLLADDDQDDVSLFQDVLSQIDNTVGFHFAKDGHEAMQILRDNQRPLPDLIFLDLNMPRMDGKQCLRELKEDPQLKKIPVIIYTTSSQSRDIEETMMCGAICFITKPSSLKELKLILTSIMNSLPHGLEKSLRALSNSTSTFIVC